MILATLRLKLKVSYICAVLQQLLACLVGSLQGLELYGGK